MTKINKCQSVSHVAVGDETPVHKIEREPGNVMVVCIGCYALWLLLEAGRDIAIAAGRAAIVADHQKRHDYF